LVSNTQENPRVLSVDDDADINPIIRLEIYGILILAFAVALFAALMSFHPADVAPQTSVRAEPIHNAMGPVGAHVAHLFLSAVGLGAFAVCGILAYLGLTYLIGRQSRITMTDVWGWFGVTLSTVVLLHLWMSPTELLGHPPGGIGGEYITEIFKAFISGPGTLLVAITLLTISVIAISRRSIFELSRLLYAGGKHAWIAVRTKRGHTAEEDSAEGSTQEDRHPPAGDEGASTESSVSLDEVREQDEPKLEIKISERRQTEPETTIVNEPQAQKEPLLPPEFEEEPSREEKEAAPIDVGADDILAEEIITPASVEDEEDLVIVESDAMKRSRVFVDQKELELESVSRQYEFPSLQILDYRQPDDGTVDRDSLTRNAQLLEAKLEDYKVQGKVVEIHPGPVITMYEFLPAPGTKISKIANLADDLAMALSALRIRIVAPIPGKNVVGIEVPNVSREMVWLKEVLSDQSHARAESKLTLSLGKDIVGNPTVMNLAKAPHVLVAGSTGSGKSVCINSFIVSLLYKSTPDDVRMIMVDPKMIELSIYEGIPHLLLPVVTDPKQAAIALRWTVKEMERRYRLLADLGVRNLASYNNKVEILLADPSQPLPDRLRLAQKKREAKGECDPEGTVLDFAGQSLERLPMIVVIIDELADLMMVASKDVETSIARLAQKARAAGIHLILATQRPSVDVITGVIKANLPTRISFLVASKVDSRTILDQSGAENLLGMGDMLYMPPGTSSVKRVHGCFVSEEEVHRVVNHVKTQGSPEYDLGILVSDEDEDGPGADRDGDEYDEFYDRAVQIVAETRNASISFLQRKLKIGYNRSARIIERMEIDGIIGPSDGTSRPREVFIGPI
jgi:S-DNA-T family DNA segregation ATPase FtsK/SpoIIIE